MIPHARARHVAVVAVLLVVTALLWVWLRPVPREFAPDLVPRATEPFGSVPREGLRFHWLLPTDEAPVSVEVLDTERQVVWRSAPTRTGTVEPTREEVARLPEGNAYWRPVAVPAGEPERPGSLAAFTVRGS